ncbi:methylaspartate mutase (plasmid) [Streptomyces sp. NBC_01216]|uniref:methylaspartate mutase n=1 Tax=Streptomyces sp. NBC_01216 TaxID=2903778 RepID=UPI002E0FBA6A|nr:methylaspartate mutase [Streptomyces sp. NBC_01216]
MRAGIRQDFGGLVRRARARGEIVVQPRMGFSDPAAMRSGLATVAALPAATAGTITVDSYTRLRDYAALREALAAGETLNGYPIVTAGNRTTRAVTRGLTDDDFQIQVRHGCPDPLDIVRSMTNAGLYATEGGPLSYCLPYGRLPVAESVENWRRTCDLLASQRHPDTEPHLETFGGCLMGQLCPPELLIAVSILEGLFFRQHGLRSVSLSYTQQTHHAQDRQALTALRTLAGDYLTGIDWHIVLYTYMGMFPTTPHGARRLRRQAARLAVEGHADRLIVKTAAEAHRIPTTAENSTALLDAAADLTAPADRPVRENDDRATRVVDDARTLIEATLELSPDVGDALTGALRRGYLDVPFCLHPDNPGRAISHIDRTGRLRWLSVGSMPLHAGHGPAAPTSTTLLADLAHVAGRFDSLEPRPGPRHQAVLSTGGIR